MSEIDQKNVSFSNSQDKVVSDDTSVFTKQVSFPAPTVKSDHAENFLTIEFENATKKVRPSTALNRSVTEATSAIRRPSTASKHPKKVAEIERKVSFTLPINDNTNQFGLSISNSKTHKISSSYFNTDVKVSNASDKSKTGLYDILLVNTAHQFTRNQRPTSAKSSIVTPVTRIPINRPSSSQSHVRPSSSKRPQSQPIVVRPVTRPSSSQPHRLTSDVINDFKNFVGNNKDFKSNQSLSVRIYNIAEQGTIDRPKTTNLDFRDKLHEFMATKKKSEIYSRPTSAKTEYQSRNENIEIDYSKPFTDFITLPKNRQSVRNNVDKFQIEQIALRRLRYVIENKTAEPDHLQMVEMIEASCIPEDMIKTYFGLNANSIHDVKILLLQALNKNRISKQKKSTFFDHQQRIKALGTELNSSNIDKINISEYNRYRGPSIPFTQGVGREIVQMIPKKNVATTPPEILAILAGLDKSAPKKKAYRPLRGGGGSASFAKKKIAKESNMNIQLQQQKQIKKSWKPVNPKKKLEGQEKNSKISKKRVTVNYGMEESDPESLLIMGVHPSTIMDPSNIVKMLDRRRASIYQT